MLVPSTIAELYTAGNYFQLNSGNLIVGYFPKLDIGSPISQVLGTFTGEPIVKCKITDSGVYIHIRCGEAEQYYKYSGYLQIIQEEDFFKEKGFEGSAYLRPEGNDVAFAYNTVVSRYIAFSSSISNEVTSIEIRLLEDGTFNFLSYDNYYCPVLASNSYDALRTSAEAKVKAEAADVASKEAQAAVERLDGTMTNVFVRR